MRTKVWQASGNRDREPERGGVYNGVILIPYRRTKRSLRSRMSR